MNKLLLVALLMLSACADAPQTSGNQVTHATFGDIVYRQMTGKVGYHMTADPADYGHYAGGTPCTPDETIELTAPEGGRTYAGTLPPGLAAGGDAAHGRLVFEGTPRQAGDWDIQVTDHGLYCLGPRGNHGAPGGGDFGDRTGALRIHIDP
jgi:hypothetical protein